jgi:2-polyprenyl-6-methoxyphenol hydroxylase-like FAD-dependent oxidoreductase
MPHLDTLDSHYDVIIVGARAAGAAASMLLARAGMNVLAVDRQGYGSDTMSTHALMRPAVMQLARWQLLDRLILGGAPLVTSTTFHYGPYQVPISIKPEPGLPGLIAPRRTVLDQTLVDAAVASGATVLHDTTARGLIVDGCDRVCGAALRDRNGRERLVSAVHVIGADGLGSMVAREVRAQATMRGRASVAHVYGYSAVPDLQGYHWYFGPGLAGGAIPTNDGLSCVVVSVPTARFDAEFRQDLAARRSAAIEQLAPDIAPYTQSTTPLRAFRGAPGLLRRAYGPGWLLVGDAGFFRDPLSSHGISDALRDAEGAAAAILSGNEAAMHRFHEERDAYALPILAATDDVSSFDWSLDNLPKRHKRFSDAMKAEAALLTARSACDRIAPLGAQSMQATPAPILRPTAAIQA